MFENMTPIRKNGARPCMTVTSDHIQFNKGCADEIKGQLFNCFYDSDRKLFALQGSDERNRDSYCFGNKTFAIIRSRQVMESIGEMITLDIPDGKTLKVYGTYIPQEDGLVFNMTQGRLV